MVFPIQGYAARSRQIPAVIGDATPHFSSFPKSVVGGAGDKGTGGGREGGKIGKKVGETVTIVIHGVFSSSLPPLPPFPPPFFPPSNPPYLVRNTNNNPRAEDIN